MALASLWNIPLSLTTRPNPVNLRLAYAKYKGIQQAQDKLVTMIKDGTWTTKKPGGDELVEVFVSKTVWHEKYKKHFPQVSKYPALQKWLEQSSDAPSNFEVFGIDKSTYGFKDLVKVIETLKKRPEKRKGRTSLDGGNDVKKGKAGTSKNK
jgi:hypothetical protein